MMGLRAFWISSLLACACASRSPEPVASTLPVASVATSALPAPSASTAASETPPATIASIERACDAPGDDDSIVAITKLDACPSGSPSHALNCQGSYDGWSLWYGKEAEAIGARRAGCPTAIVCRDPSTYRHWSVEQYPLVRTMIDRAEARALPKGAARAGGPKVYGCMM